MWGENRCPMPVNRSGFNCSAKKTFVAWVNIHRMDENTLRVLLADHLHPALTRIEGQLTDLREARDGADAKAARAAEKRFDSVLKARYELTEFIEMVTQCSDRGAPPTDPSPKKCPPRAADARYAPDLDDGVMINSAGLWPLLVPLLKRCWVVRPVISAPFARSRTA